MGNEQILEKIEENRKRMSTIQKLVDDLYCLAVVNKHYTNLLV